MLKKSAVEPNHDVIGNSVVGMRKAKSGGLLIQVRGDSAQIEAVRAEIARSTGLDAGVRTLRPRALLEIRDLDEWTTREEVENSIVA